MFFSLPTLFDTGSEFKPTDVSGIEKNIVIEIIAIVLFVILLIVLIVYRHKKNKKFREDLWKKQAKEAVEADRLKSKENAIEVTSIDDSIEEKNEVIIDMQQENVSEKTSKDGGLDEK